MRITYVEWPRERETEERLEGGGASWPCPFSAGGTLLLDPEDEETLLRPAPAPAPPSISQLAPPAGGKRGPPIGDGEQGGLYFSRSRESGVLPIGVGGADGDRRRKRRSRRAPEYSGPMGLL